MNRRTFLKAASAGAFLGGASAVRAQQPPNIIVMLADDLGSGDLGCYGSRIQTPNIDRIAAEGVRFTDFTAASDVCSPSRAALLTGRYGVRSGISWVLQAADTYGLPASETTLAATLRTAGYRTGCIGKWHLGSQPEYLPTNRGFDEYYGIPYSNDMWPLPMMRNSRIVEETAQQEMLTQKFTEQAVSFIDQAKASPFFLYVASTAPHIPLVASRRFRGKSRAGPYGDVVGELDWSVGEILKAVERNGLDDNTLVMFLSDNGPWFQGRRGGFRGRKGETWEGGMRVPFVARFPGRIPERSVRTSLATALDLFPTVAGLCRAPLPNNILDGVDIWPLLSGEQEQVQHNLFLYFDGQQLQCARLGRWKLHVARYNRTAWNPDGPGGRVNLPLPQPELYDLVDDPDEGYECSEQNPEVVAEIQDRIAYMLPTFPDGVIDAWRETMSRRVEYSPPGALPVERKR